MDLMERNPNEFNKDIYLQAVCNYLLCLDLKQFDVMTDHREFLLQCVEYLETTLTVETKLVILVLTRLLVQHYGVFLDPRHLGIIESVPYHTSHEEICVISE